MAIRNKIYIGSLDNPSYYFENDRITEAEAVQNVSLIGQELSVDSFTPTVQDNMINLISAEIFRSSDGQIIDTAIGEIYAVDVSDTISASGLINLDYGTPVWFYQNDTLVGKFYVESVRRTGANAYQIQTVSAIGVLNNMYHVGGLFTGTIFGDVLAHILASDIHGTGDPVIPYDIDDDVANLPVSGWLPYATKRQNLYQLVFSNGVNIVKNIDGNPRFTFIYTAPSNPEEVDEEVIYLEGSMDYSNPYSKVSVMEHTYTEPVSGESTVLFDNTGAEAVSNKEVFFSNAPVVVSTITAGTGLTLVSATVNSAIVSGAGQLTGVPYLHSTKESTVGDPQSAEDKTISVPDCTMVNAINSQNLLLRLFAFYCPDGHIEVARGGIQYNGERCGKVYRIKNAFRETVTAYMSSMTFTVSSFNKADIELYANYTPAGQQGLYKNVIILDAATFAEDGGTFTVPDGVTEMKVVMIGGGTGGGSGWPGHNGEDAITHTEVESTANLTAVWYGAEGGDGGEGGSGGSPGKVYSVVIQNPSATYSYTIGTGGEGGAHTGYIPDTVDELRAAMENEHPDTEYTDNELQNMINTYENSGWTGSPNPGSSGTASTFGSYSSADGVEQTVYEPITDQFFAVNGYAGIRGGKGGARQIQSDGTFNWTTDGEDVVGDDGTVWKGGSTGSILTDVEGLPEARGKLKAYGGNGAGAAVGIGRGFLDPETEDLFDTHINGGSDQATSWDITVDSEWQPPEDRPTPPAPPSPSYQPITATLTVDKTTAEVGETITWTASATGGDEEYTYFFTVMYEDDVVAQHGEWQASNSVTFTPTQKAKYYVAGFVNDNRGTGMARIENGCMVDVEAGEEEVPESNPFPSDPEPETPGEIGYVEAIATTDIAFGVVGDTITWTITPTVGSGNYEYYIQVRVIPADYGEDIYIDQSIDEQSNSYTYTTRVQGDYYCNAIVRDKDTKHLCHSFSETVHIGADIDDTTWANASNEKIVQLIQAAHRGEINLYNDLGWRVGDERIVYVKPYDLKNRGFWSHGEFHKIAISSFENYNGCGNVLQFDFTTRSTSYMYWPSQYALGTNSYRYSKTYTWYCPNCVEALPNWLKGLLLQFSVVASKSGSSVTEMVEGNKLAFRSASEVYGQAHNSVAYEGDQIDLYKNSYYRLKDRADNHAEFTGWSRMGDWGLRSIHSREKYCIPDWITGEPNTKDKNAFVDFAPFGCI